MKSRHQRGLPIFHSESRVRCDSALQTVVRAENFRLTVARRRRSFTVFPCAESLVIVDGAVKIPRAPLLTRNSLVAAAQNHARAAVRAHLHFQRRFEDFFQHILLIHFRGFSDAQALAFVQQRDAVGKFRGQI
jgi:hypothetical protein